MVMAKVNDYNLPTTPTHAEKSETSCNRTSNELVRIHTHKQGENAASPNGAGFIQTTDAYGNYVLIMPDEHGRVTRKNVYDRNFNLLISECRDDRNNRLITSFDKDRNETNIRYDWRGRITDIQRKDATGQILFDEHIYSDGSASYTKYAPGNLISSIEHINRVGLLVSVCEFDEKGREIKNVRFENGKVYSETRTEYNDGNGQIKLTHIAEEGYADFVRITYADGRYKEYGYDRHRQQTYCEEGRERGPWTRHYPTDRDFNRRLGT